MNNLFFCNEYSGANVRSCQGSPVNYSLTTCFPTSFINIIASQKVVRMFRYDGSNVLKWFHCCYVLIYQFKGWFLILFFSENALSDTFNLLSRPMIFVMSIHLIFHIRILKLMMKTPYARTILHFFISSCLSYHQEYSIFCRLKLS